ncbi:uncharacterized protein LOC143246664 [Tachypleus tridentatus]|uniref:uncharacterized protein LOC143246664 n=1 Tax=Tachypleus tridentatus TaxID=6853 RepID=UPI003FD1B811
MVNKHCCWGSCRSDSRYSGKESMRGVVFIPFPKPRRSREKCERWVRACLRKDFSIQNVTKNTYICSKHFVDGTGPTQDHPDPVPANYTSGQIRRFSRKRKAPNSCSNEPVLCPDATRSRRHYNHLFS